MISDTCSINFQIVLLFYMSLSSIWLLSIRQLTELFVKM